MRQGQASYVKGDYKTEPKAHRVSETAVSQLGTALGNHAMDSGGKILRGASKPLYEGRGLEAPMAGEQCHHCGSQGRY
jgi:hypothetical protein